MTSTVETSIDLAVVRRAAEAAAAVLPALEPLVPGTPVTGTPGAAAMFAGAAIADLDGVHGGAAVILVGSDLVQALAASPLGDLDLAAAVQPAFDVAAAALGTTARSARVLEVELVENDLGGPFTMVPLDGAAGTEAALLIADAALPRPVVVPALPEPVPARPTPAASAVAHPRGIEMLHGVMMDVTVELGRTRMTVRELLALAPGTVLELDRAAGSPADLLVNGRRIARGEVVVVDEDFGLRVTEIVNDSPAS
jgi:flagellar motor switch protein FliN